MELCYCRQCETTRDMGDNARTQIMPLCYFRQRETIADNGKLLSNGRQRGTMREHNLYNYINGDQGE